MSEEKTGRLCYPVRLIVRTVRLFAESKCPLWASALTYYSLFSIVPLLALFFGIFKGFGLEEKIETFLTDKLSNHQEILQQILEFSQNMLEHTKGGVVAGIGIVVLLYSVISMIRHIERAVESILGVKSGRGIMRIIADYLALLLICPLLLILANSATLMFNSFTLRMLEMKGWFHYLSGPLFAILQVVSAWLLSGIFFMLLFKALSNGKMRAVPAICGGLLCGLLIQALQHGYFYLQKFLTGYNAVYGSFAALPLFLMWIYVNWNLILIGVAFASAMQGMNTLEFDSEDTEKESRAPGRRLLILTAALITKYYSSARKAPDDELLASRCGVGLRRMRLCLDELKKAEIIFSVNKNDGTSGYIPAIPPEMMTIGRVMERLDAENIPLNPCDAEVRKVNIELGRIYQDDKDLLLGCHLKDI